MKVFPAIIAIFLTPLFAKEAPETLTHALEKSFTERSATFPKANAGALEGEARVKPLLHLRYLLEMEGILREILNDDADLEKQLPHDDFTSFEKKRIIKMRTVANTHRATVLVTPIAEERITKIPELESLGQPSVIVMPKVEEPGSNPVRKLQEAYQRKARKYITFLSKNRKLLNKEYDSSRPDERRITKLEEEIEAAKSDLSRIQTAFFGNIPRKGFEAPFPEGETSLRSPKSEPQKRRYQKGKCRRDSYSKQEARSHSR